MRLIVFFAAAFSCLAFGAIAEDRVIVRGDNEYQPLRLKKLKDGTSIDLNGARFRVAFSGNENPTEEANCKIGPAKINRYPFAIEHSPGVAIDGGLFAGEAPQASDWLHTYCNSAAVRLEQSPEASVREMRIRRVWDGIRIGEGTGQFRIARVWMSEVRDDCIENDFLMAGRIRNSLFDGCFSGISVAPVNETKKRSVVRLSKVLMRMKEYPYRGELRHTMPIKVKESGGARFEIYDSIFALETEKLIGQKNSQIMWDSISKCKNNKLLWLGTGDLPEFFEDAPSCFQVVSGPEARSIWELERQLWIDENQGVARFTTEDGL